MITFKKIILLSDEELEQYITELTNDFNATKAEIIDKCHYLEDLDEEYAEAKEELNTRKNG